MLVTKLKNMSVKTYGDTMTLTFGDVAENHAGMQQIGAKASEGFSVSELKEIGENF